MSDFDYEDEFEEDHEEDYEFDCGQVDDKRLCVDAGSEHCGFWCPYSSWVMAQNPDDFPEPEDVTINFADSHKINFSASDDDSDIPF